MKLAFVFVVLAAVSSGFGNIMIKVSRGATAVDTAWYMKFFSPYFALGILGYVLSLAFFAKSLDELPVSIGYPMMASIGFTLLTVASAYWLGEKVSLGQMAGLACVIVGIILLARAH